MYFVSKYSDTIPNTAKAFDSRGETCDAPVMNSVGDRLLFSLDVWIGKELVGIGVLQESQSEQNQERNHHFISATVGAAGDGRLINRCI